MKTLVLADIQNLHFETSRQNKRIDFIEFMKQLKDGAWDVKHAIAYTQPMSEGFERVLASCGFEVVTDKDCHTHRLCIDAINTAQNFDHVIIMSTRYYVAPLVHTLKRMGKAVTIFGFNTPGHIKVLTDYYDIEIFRPTQKEQVAFYPPTGPSLDDDATTAE